MLEPALTLNGYNVGPVFDPRNASIRGPSRTPGSYNAGDAVGPWNAPIPWPSRTPSVTVREPPRTPEMHLL